MLADERGRKQRHQNQIDGSRADDDSEPRTHKVANAIPIIPNVSTKASSQNAAKRFAARDQMIGKRFHKT
jgi:hypothetical protein